VDSRTPLQSSDSRKKISFRWNSRTYPGTSLVVTSRSKSTGSASSGSKLVPYEDDISDDDSDTGKEATETSENAGDRTDEKTDADGGASLTAGVPLLNGNSCEDATVDARNTAEALQLKPAEEPIVTSIPASSNERLKSPVVVVNNSNHTATVSTESASGLVPPAAAEVELRRGAAKEDGAAQGCLVDGGTVSSTEPTVATANDKSSPCMLVNGGLSADSNAARHESVDSRKRRAHRHKLSRRHGKRRRRHRSTDTDEDVEYVWVERTVDTVAQQRTGKYCRQSFKTSSVKH